MAVRLITAAVGIAVGIGVLFLSDTMFFYIVLAIISMFIIHELFSAEDCREYKSECITCYLYTVCVHLFLGFETLMDFDRFWRYLLSILCVFALFALFVIDKKRIPFDKLCVMAASAVLVNGSISCIGTVKDYSDVHGVCYVVLVLAGAWLGDAGAYFVGSAIGKHKLCPDISPKKTVEGAIGGVVTTGIIFAIYAYLSYGAAFYGRSGFQCELHRSRCCGNGMRCTGYAGRPVRFTRKASDRYQGFRKAYAGSRRYAGQI